ncbi:unnamed protein product [Ambrosiozyma monospora]|uniref:Unnamed protein product n=1 Tax=Ambrosiozyma monospora TaxID=43982 RepID=A0ACB5T413_AMBMO|nr:unnamed protein product [Ambrosiozyma monospora]
MFPARLFSMLSRLEELYFLEKSTTDTSKVNLPESLRLLHLITLPFSEIRNPKQLKQLKELFFHSRSHDVPTSFLRKIPSTTKIFSFNYYPKTETDYQFDLSLIPESVEHVALTLGDCPSYGSFSDKLTYLSLNLCHYPAPFVEIYKKFKIGQLSNLLTFVTATPQYLENDFRDIVFPPKLYHFEMRLGRYNSALDVCQTPMRYEPQCIRVYEIPERVSEFILILTTSDLKGNMKVIASGEMSVEELRRKVITVPYAYDFEFL